MSENDLLVKTVDFEGDQLKAAQEPKSKKVYVGVRWVCEGLGFTKDQMKRQLKNIREDIVTSKGVSSLTLPTNGGSQATLCIELDFLPLWLAKISITPAMKRDNPFVVQKLVDYQLKAKDVLAKAFISKDGETAGMLQFLQGVLDQMKYQQKEIEETKDNVVQIKHYLADTPDRKKLEREVDAFVRRTNTPHAHVWKMLYDKIEDKYGINIPLRVQHKQKKINDQRIHEGKKPLKLITLQGKYNGMAFLAENNMFKDAMEILAGMYNKKNTTN